jgi:hypothetical protein
MSACRVKIAMRKILASCNATCPAAAPWPLSHPAICGTGTANPSGEKIVRLHMAMIVGSSRAVHTVL